MHRLKEWFGIKDWQGPNQSPESEPTIDEASSETGSSSAVQSETGLLKKAEYEHTTSPTVADGVSQPGRKFSENLFFKYSSQFEVWLRHYIPVEQNECAQCRLVVATFVGTIATALVYKSYQVEKINPVLKGKKVYFRALLFSFSALSAFLLHDWLFKKGMYQAKRDEETQKELLLRTLKEDMEWYKYYINKMQDKLKKTTTISIDNDSKEK